MKVKLREVNQFALGHASSDRSRAQIPSGPTPKLCTWAANMSINGFCQGSKGLVQPQVLSCHTLTKVIKVWKTKDFVL